MWMAYTHVTSSIGGLGPARLPPVGTPAAGAIRRRARPRAPFAPAGSPPPPQATSSSSAADPLPPLVQQLLETPGLEAPEGSSPAQMLRVAEAFWRAMKDPAAASKPAPTVVTRAPGPLPAPAAGPPEFDVCVAGGTLGVFLALALQQRGHRVCIVERHRLQGRTQEWNISGRELQTLAEAGLLTAEELAAAVETEWELDRVGFKGGSELWVSDVLNLGVSPRRLLATLRRRFLAAGGVLLEGTAFKSAVVYDNGALIELLPGGGATELTPADVNRPTAVAATAAAAVAAGASGQPPRRRLTARLLVDCMGHYSPIVRQVRAGQRPDGMVLVVGGAFAPRPGAPPLPSNASADLLYSFTDSFDDAQLFWEAFPAEGGAARTAYAFIYSDTHPARPPFAALLDTYLRLLPKYQGLASLDDVTFKRVLFGGFPCYMRGSPLAPAFDRVLQIGDAAAAQSPLSFGGFSAMVRHLPRLARGADQALREDRLRRRDLRWLQPYQPSLSAAWLFQRSMSVGVGQLRAARAGEERDGAAEGEPSDRRAGGWLPRDHINRLLRCNFAVLRFLGDRVLRPFVQDSLQALPLALTMWGMMVKDPVTVGTVLLQTGPRMVADWFRHFFALAGAAAAFALLRPLRPWVRGYRFQRLLDALEYGSASDYEHAPGKVVHVGPEELRLRGEGGEEESGGAAEEAAQQEHQPVWAPQLS